MPPLATTEFDYSGMELIQRWIDESLASYETFDEWVLTHFDEETDPLIVGRDVDPDLDGESNYLEYLNRTDPLSANSKSHFEIAHGAGGIRLELSASEFSDYLIESSSDMLEWGPAGGGEHSVKSLAEAAETIVLEIEETSESEKAFYRVNARER